MKSNVNKTWKWRRYQYSFSPSYSIIMSSLAYSASTLKPCFLRVSISFGRYFLAVPGGALHSLSIASKYIVLRKLHPLNSRPTQFPKAKAMSPLSVRWVDRLRLEDCTNRQTPKGITAMATKIMIQSQMGWEKMSSFVSQVLMAVLRAGKKARQTKTKAEPIDVLRFSATGSMIHSFAIVRSFFITDNNTTDCGLCQIHYLGGKK